MKHTDPSYFFSKKLIWKKLVKLYPINDTIVDFIIHLVLTCTEDEFTEKLCTLSGTIDVDTCISLYISIKDYYSETEFDLKKTALSSKAIKHAKYIAIDQKINVAQPMNFRITRNTKSSILKTFSEIEDSEVATPSVLSSVSSTLNTDTLPIDSYAPTIKTALKQNRVVILQGDPGCGKSTRLPSILLSMGYTKIAITEPRRVAAVSLADRVASQLDQSTGQDIGYIVRFGSQVSQNTKVTFMTDGVLLKMLNTDEDLSKYEVIVLDDCHNRSIATELLVGFLSIICKRRLDLRIIISSATIDTSLFSSVFSFVVPVLKVPGRTFPVEVSYLRDTPADYVAATIEAVKSIIKFDTQGHILAFLTGKNEIDFCVRAVSSIAKHAVVLPLYAALDRSAQQQVFKEFNRQKIVFATNIAEAAITINNITHVVDCGLMKEDFFDPVTSLSSLRTVPISKDQANQRAGRAGRTIAGTCHRLYPRSVYTYDFIEHPIPEISRADLTSLIVTLKSLNVENLNQFPFIEAPHPNLLAAAIDTLTMLKALDSQQQLSINGYFMSMVPLDPPLVSMIVEASKLGVGMDALYVCSFLTAFTSFKIPSHFASNESELTSIAEICKAYMECDHKLHFCKDYKISIREMRDFENIYSQCMSSCSRLGISLQMNHDTSKLTDSALKAFPLNCAHLVDEEYLIGAYKALGRVYSDCVFEEKPQWIHFVRSVKTSRTILSGISVIDTSKMLELDHIYRESKVPTAFDDKRFAIGRVRAK